MPRPTLSLLLAASSVFIASAAQSAPTPRTPKLAYAVFSPQPDYPHVAWVNGWQGTGVFVMRIQIKSGRVKEVSVSRTTGHKDLDAAAIAALKQWRFKPNALPSIRKILPHRVDPFAAEDSLARIPVTFVIR